jgi:hypothetical protein
MDLLKLWDEFNGGMVVWKAFLIAHKPEAGWLTGLIISLLILFLAICPLRPITLL